ncbi:MAG TPA: ImmA/IrrE family metallo-endopeptidase [Solirubrobacteraceae bacterium]|nr:ImmA/IrrE family metallo-endopeptidase [Solirubrobacteraceae bacterium]
MAGIDSNRGAKRAREARRALGLDPAAPLPCLLTAVEERAALPVVVARMPEDVAGACYRDGDGAVLWVNGRQGRPRQRFTLAHELGHAWCRHEGRLEVDTFEALSGRTTSPLEVQANSFAAEFLLPRAGMRDLVTGQPTLDEVVVIAAHYGVSAIVVVYRLKQLLLASRRRIEQLEAEVDEHLHEQAFQRLELRPLDDRLGSIAHLPYLSPALRGTHLEAALRGEAATDARLAGAIDRLLG